MSTLRRTGLKFFSVVVLTLTLSACSSVTSVMTFGLLGANNELSTVRIEASANCNRNMPVALDLVFVSDAKLAQLLLGLSGPDWFSRKQELLMRYDEQLQVASFEVVPLTIVDDLPLPDKHKNADNVLLFANYLSREGQYVAQLGNFADLTILLDRDRYRLLDEDED